MAKTCIRGRGAAARQQRPDGAPGKDPARAGGVDERPVNVARAAQAGPLTTPRDQACEHRVAVAPRW